MKKMGKFYTKQLTGASLEGSAHALHFTATSPGRLLRKIYKNNEGIER